MPQTDANQLMFAIMLDMGRAAADFVGKAKAEIVDHLSVPVEIVVGPRGGIKKIRSKKGEHARKDSGELVEGIEADAIVSGMQLDAAVFTDVYHALPLERDLDRLVMTIHLDEYAEGFIDCMVEAIENE